MARAGRRTKTHRRPFSGGDKHESRRQSSKGPAHEGHAEPPAVSAGRAWYAVGVLLVAYVFSIMDRQILTLLVGPIQQTLHVNDTLMGMLHGFTFAAFYALMGLPIARIIDRGDRRLVIAVGIALWSLATAAGGLATRILAPAASRASAWRRRGGADTGRGVAGRGLFTRRPARPSDERVRRERPVRLGARADRRRSDPRHIHPHAARAARIGHLQPWQATFMALGLPGLIVALLMLRGGGPRHAKHAVVRRGDAGGGTGGRRAARRR